MGLKLMRHEFSDKRTKTPPTPGSITQKKKANRDAHKTSFPSKRK